jgi:hypothetical protein
MALCLSLKDIIINLGVFKEPIICIPSVKQGGLCKNRHYAHALGKVNKDEPLTTLIIANRTRSESPELLIPYHDVVPVTDLSLNKFGNKGKGVLSSFGYPKDKYFYRPKSTTPTDLLLM